MAEDKSRFVPFQIALDSLLQFLRIKGGQGPNELGLRVDPSIDVTDFYGASAMLQAFETAAAAVMPQLTPSTPATFTRRYVAMSGFVTIGAAPGTTCTLSLGFRLGSTGNGVYLASLGPFVPVAAGIYRIGADIRGLILPPQHQLLFRVDGNAGGSDHVSSIEYSYQRLDGLP